MREILSQKLPCYTILNVGIIKDKERPINHFILKEIKEI